MIIKTIQRIRKAWALSKAGDVIYFDPTKLNEQQLKELQDSRGVISVPQAPLGDGKATFFGDPTPEEQLEHEREERGEKGWYDRLKKMK